MLKVMTSAIIALSLVGTPANAMCCGAKDKVGADSKMQCMKMDMDKSGQKATGDQSDSKDPHAGMDMGKEGTMDHSEMSGCGCCGEKKSQ